MQVLARAINPGFIEKWGATTGTTASFKSFSHEKSVMKKTFDPKWDEGRYAQLDEMSRAASKL